MMINFNKNKLINMTLDKYYDTFAHTLDTSDFVPDKFNKKICKYIFKNMRKAFRRIDKEDRKYQSMVNKKERKKQKEIKKMQKIQEKEQKKLKNQGKINIFRRLFKKKVRKSADSNSNS